MMEPESYPMFAWLCSPWITYVRIARDICINHRNLALRDPQNLRARLRNRHFVQRSQVIRPFAKAGEFCWHFFWLGPAAFNRNENTPFDFLTQLIWKHIMKGRKSVELSLGPRRAARDVK